MLSLFNALFCEKYVDDGLPPVPVCALVPPPSQVRGARPCTTSAPLATAQTALQIPIQVIGFSKHTDILEFGALARSAIASPGGKLSSAARLMRNGETERFSMQFVKKARFEKLYVLICLRPNQKMSPFLIRPCGAPSPRGKVLARQFTISRSAY